MWNKIGWVKLTSGMSNTFEVPGGDLTWCRNAIRAQADGRRYTFVRVRARVKL